jgi:hypothetical protein
MRLHFTRRTGADGYDASFGAVFTLGGATTPAPPTLALEWDVLAPQSALAATVLLLLDWDVVGKTDSTTQPEPLLTLDWRVTAVDPMLRLAWDVVELELTEAYARPIHRPIAVGTLRRVE